MINTILKRACSAAAGFSQSLRRVSCLVLSLGAIGASQLAGAEVTSLEGLFERVKSGSSAEAERNRQREARFASSAAEKAVMLREVQAKVRQQEALKDRLKTEFDSNEDRLVDITTTLDRRIGDLGELFGVFRQTADDTQNLLFDSLVTLEYPERRGKIEVLASSTEVPTIPEMQELWTLLIQEIAYSGEISRFETDIVAPGGTIYSDSVVRVGMFNAISGDRYLNHLTEENVLAELPRQPAGFARATAADLANASDQTVAFAIDPSRGALLGLLVQSPSLLERIEQGKAVGYVILFGLFVGLVLVLERWARHTKLQGRINKQLKDLDSVSDDNPLGRIVATYYENQHLDDLETISRKLETIVIKDVAAVTAGLPVIKILATVAPLTGLLGTVVGMIETFQSITLFGTGDPKLMAGGISMALITTVLGLVAAIPLLISHTFLSAKAASLSKVIAEQAAGMMAMKAEQIAVAKLEKG